MDFSHGIPDGWNEKSMVNQEHGNGFNFLNDKFMAEIKFDDLLKTGAHFGHVTARWNPYYEPFVLMVRNGVHIINLEETIKTSIMRFNFCKIRFGIRVKFYLWVLKNRPRISFKRKQIDVACSMLWNAGWEVH